MNVVGPNHEAVTLQIRAEYLKNRCAEEVEEYMMLVTVKRQNIETRYMVEVGGLEHHVFELKLSALRWKRRLELRQKALNCGEAPNLMAIEMTVDLEMAQYRAELEKQRKAVARAREYLARGNMTAEEISAIRMGYLKAAKKLHPDLNSNLSESARVLWQKIQDVYRAQEWAEVSFYVGLVDEVLKGTMRVEPPKGLNALRAQIKGLDEKLKALVQKRRKLMKTPPFCHLALLDDESALAARQDGLHQQIAELEETIRDYEAMWNVHQEAA